MKAGTLKDGHGITIALTGFDFSLVIDPNSITPPGVDGGDPIETTSHSNVAFRTKWPRSLKEITDAAMTVAYNPSEYSTIMGALNVNTTITFTFPNTGAGALAIRGYLKSFQPSELVEGEEPTAECVLVVTNEAANGTESGPGYTP